MCAPSLAHWICLPGTSDTHKPIPGAPLPWEWHQQKCVEWGILMDPTAVFERPVDGTIDLPLSWSFAAPLMVSHLPKPIQIFKLEMHIRYVAGLWSRSSSPPGKSHPASEMCLWNTAKKHTHQGQTNCSILLAWSTASVTSSHPIPHYNKV